jgi:hypothetical protein
MPMDKIFALSESGKITPQFCPRSISKSSIYSRVSTPESRLSRKISKICNSPYEMLDIAYNLEVGVI